jgi:N4-gp56 family major capsid protein
MSYTSFARTDAYTVQLWEKALALAERAYLDIAPLIGTSPNSIIQLKPQTKKGPGDKIVIGLRARLTGDGISESDVAEGNGEALSIYSDSFVLNELGHVVGVKSANTIDAQRVPFDLREEAKDGLAQWWSDRMSKSFFNQVCGNTAETRTKYTGLNATLAPTTNRKIYAGASGAISADESASSSTYNMTLDLIDRAKTVAMVGDDTQRVRPLKIGGQEKYVVYMHPLQARDLRTNTATGQWLDIMKFALSGTGSTKHPIYDGALGEYNGCILRISQDVATGVNSSTAAAVTTVRRAVLLGAQAAAIAYGQKGGTTNKYRWNEELLDHKRRLEVGSFAIFGMKKLVWNSQDFGTVTISTYAA